MNTTNKYDLIQNTLLTEVSGRLKEFDLLRKKLLVATSGGNDSTALLLIIGTKEHASVGTKSQEITLFPSTTYKERALIDLSI